MSRSNLGLTLMLGAGFSTIATTISQLTVYDGGAGFVALIPVLLGIVFAYDEFRPLHRHAHTTSGLTPKEETDA